MLFVRVVIICPASTHTALVSSPSLAVLHLTTYLPSGCRQPRQHALEGSAGGTRLEGDSREGTAGNRGVGLAFDKTGIALPANLSLTCALRRADGGRAEVARQAKLYANGMRSRIGSRASTRIRSPIELSPPVSAR